jgi:hypothetical protein
MISSSTTISSLAIHILRFCSANPYNEEGAGKVDAAAMIFPQK